MAAIFFYHSLQTPAWRRETLRSRETKWDPLGLKEPPLGQAEWLAHDVFCDTGHCLLQSGGGPSRIAMISQNALGIPGDPVGILRKLDGPVDTAKSPG